MYKTAMQSWIHSSAVTRLSRRAQLIHGTAVSTKKKHRRLFSPVYTTKAAGLVLNYAIYCKFIPTVNQYIFYTNISKITRMQQVNT